MEGKSALIKTQDSEDEDPETDTQFKENFIKCDSWLIVYLIMVVAVVLTLGRIVFLPDSVVKIVKDIPRSQVYIRHSYYKLEKLSIIKCGNTKTLEAERDDDFKQGVIYTKPRGRKQTKPVINNNYVMFGSNLIIDNTPPDVNVLLPQCKVSDDAKFDCHPENKITQAKCEARGCCWQTSTKRKKPVNATDPAATQAPVDLPYCFYPSNFPGYSITNVVETAFGYSVDLERTVKSYYPNDIMKLHMNILFENETRLRFKIFDPANKRYEVPLQTPSFVKKAENPDYLVRIKNNTFAIQVTRISTKTIILDTAVGAFIYADQFLQISTKLPSKHITGLGEHRQGLMINPNWTRFTMWNKDQPPLEDTNEYGDHPFYLSVESGASSHGVFLLNSNAMDVVLQPGTPNPSLTYRTIGGILDFYIFMGPKPNEVIKQYTEVIGRTFFPAIWQLGFHLSRWGIGTATNLLALVDKVQKAGIPLSAQWYDIDYMKDKLDFTWDNKTYGDLAATVWKLRTKGLANVIIVDPGISNSRPGGRYLPYDSGFVKDIFIKDSTGTKNLVGKVWPGTVVFPDFSNKKTKYYWLHLVTKFRELVYFDGIWIDMNEPSNMVTGSIDGCPDNSLENPPYVPAVRGNSLRFNTICASAKQHLSSHYNLHNVYGFQESQATHMALRAQDSSKRPLVLSRSTFAGSGQYAAHWTGDNNSTFSDLAKSIPAILRMNMFGISMVGADICGFNGNTTEELCQRWYQLGAFYPFCRNHNHKDSKDQDPTAFGDNMAAAVKKVLDIRHSLIPYFYYLFLQSHVNGDTVVRPLFFEYPSDSTTYNINYQFMWGKCLLVSPVVTAGATKVTAYFPADLWYDFYTLSAFDSKGENKILDAPLDMINLHVRGGCILPTLHSTWRGNPGYKLIAALDSTGEANGTVYIDDGGTFWTYTNGLYRWIDMVVSNQIMTLTMTRNGFMGWAFIDTIQVLGVDTEPSVVFVNTVNTSFTYNNDTLVMTVPLTEGTFPLTNVKMKWT